MNKRIRTALVAVSALATLAFASAALAANTGSVSVWHTPQTLANSASTTIHVNVPQTTDPIAAVNIYSGTGYTLNTSQAANTQIGTVEATAFSRDNNLTLPLSGTVVTSDATAAANKTGSAQCAGVPQSQAVWIMNLSVAGNTLAIPVYVNPTAGPEQTLGGYKLSICLPPPDVPVGTPGRAFQGAQLLDAKLTLEQRLHDADRRRPRQVGDAVHAVQPGQRHAEHGRDVRGTRVRAAADHPRRRRSSTRTRRPARTSCRGKATEGGAPVSGLTLTVAPRR